MTYPTSLLILEFVCCWGAAGAGAAVLPTVSIEAVTPAASEAGPTNAMVIFRRTGDTNQPLTVEYTISGTAQDGTDYRRLPGAITFLAGRDTAPLLVQPIDDAKEEPTETIELTLTTNTRPFSLVILPDTQGYTCCGGYYLDFFASQTRWIVQNKDALNIAFVLHEGDGTDGNTEPEWVNFNRYMTLLDGVVPYAIAVGNHDGLMTSNSMTELFNQFFPVSRYRSRPTFGGVFESNRMDNCYHLFSAGGLDWLVLDLEFGPRNEVLTWANQVVAAHPNRRVILLTHTHVYSDDTLHGSSPAQYWLPTSYGRQNDGTDVWEKLVRRHANISFVFNGHVLNDGAGRVVGTGDHTNQVYQMLANYQTLWNGGNAFLRLVQFFPAEDRFTVKTYSPFTDSFWVSPEHDFAYTNLGLFSLTNATYQVDPARNRVTLTLADNDRDEIPPALLDVSAMGIPSEITVAFSEPVDPVSGGDLASYQVNYGMDLLDVVVDSDGRRVMLTTADLLSEGVTYTLTVNGVKDRASMPNPIAANSQKSFIYLPVLMAESFDDDHLRNWLIVDEGTRDGPSNWNVRYGRLEQSANIHGPNSLALDNRKGTYACWNRPSAFGWSNYTFSVTLRSMDDDGLGLLFRYQGPDNYYKLELDRQKNFRKLIKLVAGQESLLAEEAAGYEQNQDVQLQVEVDGTAIRSYLDGVQLFGGPIEDASLGRGTVALYSWGSEGVAFDNVVVAPGHGAIAPPVGTNSNPAASATIKTLVAIDSAWMFWPFEEPPAGGWQQPEFDDRAWPGPNFGIFASDPDMIPDPLNTSLSLGPVAFYFRQRFTFPGSTNGVTLRLRHLIDDGAVVYLNGREILRTGMPEGPVYPVTEAAREVDNALYEGPFDIPVTNLVSGENLLAVEVHQSSAYSEDVAFGLEAEALIPAPQPARFWYAKFLATRRLQLVLSGETGRSYALESSTNLVHWQPLLVRTNIPNPTMSLLLDPPPGPQRFYRAVTLP